jgi:hypothetical protein
VSEDYIQLPPDGTGKRLRALRRTVSGVEVYSEVFALEGFGGRITTPSRDEMDRRFTYDITYDAQGNIASVKVTDKETGLVKIKTFTYDAQGNLIRVDEEWG